MSNEIRVRLEELHLEVNEAKTICCTVFCKHLMPKVACEKCTKVHVHFVHYCSGRAAGQATANISVISSF